MLSGIMALSFMAGVAAPAAAPASTKRRREASNGSGAKPSVDKQVEALSAQLKVVMSLVSQHDRDLRELEAWSTFTILLKKETPLAQELLQAMQGWKDKLPEKGAHPLGPPRWAVAGALAQWLVLEEERQSKMPHLFSFHNGLTQLSDMESSVQLAMVRETKDQKVLLRVRPQLNRQSEWQEAVLVLKAVVAAEGGEFKTGAAPPNPLVRKIESRHGAR